MGLNIEIEPPDYFVVVKIQACFCRPPAAYRSTTYSCTRISKSSAIRSPRRVLAFLPSINTGAAGVSPVPGNEMPISACLDSPGPLTMQPMTATFKSSTPDIFHASGACFLVADFVFSRPVPEIRLKWFARIRGMRQQLAQMSENP